MDNPEMLETLDTRHGTKPSKKNKTQYVQKLK